MVLTTGCDKTTPACIMAAATVDLPAIVLSGGPMLDGHIDGKLAGSGTIIWESRLELAAGTIDYDKFMQAAAAAAPSAGYCNTMGTASTMNSLAEALGMSLPGNASIPAPYRERGQMAYLTGKRIVEMVDEDLRPSKILTRKAIENAIQVNSAIGGSTNAQPHITAIARHAGVELKPEDWQTVGYDVPLLVNVQPAGKYLSEGFHIAGGIPVVMKELIANGKLHGDALTVSGKTAAENVAFAPRAGRRGDQALRRPMKEKAGFIVLKGNLFDSAIMKTSVISDDFRTRYLARPGHENVLEGRAVVFDGSEDYHHRIDDPSLEIDENTILVIRYGRPDRLAGLGRGGEHAAAGGAHQARRRLAALHRRRPPVRHLRLALDPERLAGSGDRRRPRPARDRRRRADRPQHGRRRRHRSGGRVGAPPRRLQAELPGRPDPLAGDLPREGRPAGGGRGAGDGGEVPRRLQRHPARQPLISPLRRGRRGDLSCLQPAGRRPIGAISGRSCLCGQSRRASDPIGMVRGFGTGRVGRGNGAAWGRQAEAVMASTDDLPESRLPAAKIADRRTVYAGWLTLDVVVVDTTLRGAPARIRREVHDHGNGAAVLAYDPERRTAVLVRQVRAAALVADGSGVTVEAIAGIVDAGEDPAETVRREALEEAGITVGRTELVGAPYSSPGAVTERVWLYLGEIDTSVPRSGRRRGGGRARGDRGAGRAARVSRAPRRHGRPHRHEDHAAGGGVATPPAGPLRLTGYSPPPPLRTVKPRLGL